MKEAVNHKKAPQKHKKAQKSWVCWSQRYPEDRSEWTTLQLDFNGQEPIRCCVQRHSLSKPRSTKAFPAFGIELLERKIDDRY
jgi:hypothetical protein